MRKKNMDRKRLLLDCARRIQCTEGTESLSIRRLASEAHIAVGTIYNYFESKQDVLLAMTEEYWQNALSEMQVEITSERFSEQVRQMYRFLCEKMDECAKILMRSLRENPESGRARMAAMQQKVEQALVEQIKRDKAIRKNVWNEQFRREAFASFVLSNIMLLLRKKREESLFFEIIERILY